MDLGKSCLKTHQNLKIKTYYNIIFFSNNYVKLITCRNLAKNCESWKNLINVKNSQVKCEYLFQSTWKDYLLAWESLTIMVQIAFFIYDVNYFMLLTITSEQPWDMLALICSKSLCNELNVSTHFDWQIMCEYSLDSRSLTIIKNSWVECEHLFIATP